MRPDRACIALLVLARAAAGLRLDFGGARDLDAEALFARRPQLQRRAHSTETTESTEANAGTEADDGTTATMLPMEDSEQSSTDDGIDVESTITLSAPASDSTDATSVVSLLTASTTSERFSTSTALPSDFTLPSPLDDVVSGNFQSAECREFVDSIAANENVTKCAPFFLLLGTSSAWFDMYENPYSEIKTVLDHGCEEADRDLCAGIMDDLAREMRKSDVCRDDVENETPVAVETFNGLLNYRLGLDAACLKNAETSQYCFIDALVNEDPSSFYFYFLVCWPSDLYIRTVLILRRSLRAIDYQRRSSQTATRASRTSCTCTPTLHQTPLSLSPTPTARHAQCLPRSVALVSPLTSP